MWYRSAKIPGNAELRALIGSSAQALGLAAQGTDVKKANLDKYSRRYLLDYLNDPHWLEHYTYLLAVALDGLEPPITIVDYGGGTGLMSCLAKWLSLGPVIYTDVYDVSCRDAKTIGRMLGSEADAYVQGTERQLIEYLGGCDKQSLVIVSFDVLEHIYNPVVFLNTIGPFCASYPRARIVMSSSANTLNPRTKRLTERLQRKLETENRAPKDGQKERDTLEAWSAVRGRMIKESFPHLSSDDVAMLADRTRGLAGTDIIAAATFYVKKRIVPQPAHPTNTCDPVTGNGGENLLDPHALISVLEQHGLRGQVLPGYYARCRSIPKRMLTRCLNTAIAAAPDLGLRVAPHYIIAAVKNPA